MFIFQQCLVPYTMFITLRSGFLRPFSEGNQTSSPNQVTPSLSLRLEREQHFRMECAWYAKHRCNFSFREEVGCLFSEAWKDYRGGHNLTCSNKNNCINIVMVL